jgi:hypothetical protein
MPRQMSVHRRSVYAQITTDTAGWVDWLGTVDAEASVTDWGLLTALAHSR